MQFVCSNIIFFLFSYFSYFDVKNLYWYIYDEHLYSILSPDVQYTGTETDIVTNQADLPIRTMSDSYNEAIIPIGADEILREKYINFYGGIRFGRIMEDLDTFGGDFILSTFQTKDWYQYLHYNNYLVAREILKYPSEKKTQQFLLQNYIYL